jgi:hypothetical protein
VERAEIGQALDRAEAAVAAGSRLGGTGFWKAVGAVKGDRGLVPEFAERIASIDRRAFESWALFTVPVGIGTAVMALATLAGLAVVWAAYTASPTWAGLFLLAGTVTTLVTTHGLAHLLVGTVLGMRFTHWFIGSMSRPQPGVKVDYATYLAAPPRSRAWMHASGALVSKAIPFFALGPALVISVPWWATAILVALGVGQIVTDVVWSTKSSDWKKFRREMRYAA